MAKKILILALRGAALGVFIFAIVGVTFDLYNGGRYVLEDWSYTKMFLAACAIGAGFSAPALIYRSERVPYLLKVVFHMGIGICITLAVGTAVGWYGPDTLFAIPVSIACSFVIWFFYTLRSRQLARKMNEKLHEKKP